MLISSLILRLGINHIRIPFVEHLFKKLLDKISFAKFSESGALKLSIWKENAVLASGLECETFTYAFDF